MECLICALLPAWCEPTYIPDPALLLFGQAWRWCSIDLQQHSLLCANWGLIAPSEVNPNHVLLCLGLWFALES